MPSTANIFLSSAIKFRPRKQVSLQKKKMRRRKTKEFATLYGAKNTVDPWARYVYAPNDMYINLMLESLCSTRLSQGSAADPFSWVLFSSFSVSQPPTLTPSHPLLLYSPVVGVTFPFWLHEYPFPFGDSTHLG